MNIGIIGNGFVGKATSIIGNTSYKLKVLCYDIRSELCKPSGTTMADILTCNMIFICIPTIMGFNGKCEIGEIVSIVKELRNKEYSGYIVIRSTVPPGTCRKLGCFNMPEFITEASYESDFINQSHRIIGTNDHLPNNTAFKSHFNLLI